MKIEVVNKSNNPLPSYATMMSAGMDLCAFLPSSITLQPMERKIIPTGLYIALPKGYEAQIRARSGLAIKKGLAVLNAPGTIDADYRGEIGIILINLSKEEITIHSGERIAQMIVSQYENVEWQETDQLSSTLRGKGGFGHTGTTL